MRAVRTHLQQKGNIILLTGVLLKKKNAWEKGKGGGGKTGRRGGGGGGKTGRRRLNWEKGGKIGRTEGVKLGEGG